LSKYRLFGKNQPIHIKREQSMPLNKSDVVAALSEETSLTNAQAQEAVTAILKTISDELTAKGTVTFPGFGSFSTKERAARTGRNPQTGESMEIKASTAVAFKSGKTLKDSVNA